MHIILKQYMEDLVRDFELTKDSESKQFEYFCNFCTVSKNFLGRFNPKDITTQEDDASIDGIAIVIDGDLITTVDDATSIFSSYKSNLSVDIIFTQVKSGDKFNKEEINNFQAGLKDFLTLEPEYPQGKFNKTMLEILKIVFSNLKKIKNKRPSAYVYYCTSGIKKDEKEIVASFDIFEKTLVDSDMFHEAKVHPLGRSELLSLWTHITDKNEAQVKLIEYFGMPNMPDIPQSYMGIINAKEYVDKLLSDQEGNIKLGVFEENIRSYLGEDNEVNHEIRNTLSDPKKKSLFSVLNNGITIVAPEITLTANSKLVDLTNYQIINGCQTSNTLYSCRDILSDDVNVIVKFIESPKNEVSTDIISATNSQTRVPNESFHGLKTKAKLVQKYFDTRNKKSAPENKVYFERRENEYRDFGHQTTRVFDIRETARAYAAMFLNQPHNSARYVKTIFKSSDLNLFKDTDSEALYYCSVLALYKYNTLINGRKHNAHSFNKLRWHVLYIFKWVVHNEVNNLDPGSKKSDAFADKIIRILTSEKKDYIAYFEKCHEIIELSEAPTDDSLKRGKFTADLRSATENYLKK